MLNLSRDSEVIAENIMLGGRVLGNNQSIAEDLLSSRMSHRINIPF